MQAKVVSIAHLLNKLYNLHEAVIPGHFSYNATISALMIVTLLCLYWPRNAPERRGKNLATLPADSY